MLEADEAYSLKNYLLRPNGLPKKLLKRLLETRIGYLYEITRIYVVRRLSRLVVLRAHLAWQ